MKLYPTTNFSRQQAKISGNLFSIWTFSLENIHWVITSVDKKLLNVHYKTWFCDSKACLFFQKNNFNGYCSYRKALQLPRIPKSFSGLRIGRKRYWQASEWLHLPKQVWGRFMSMNEWRMPIEHCQNPMSEVNFVGWRCKPSRQLERWSANSFCLPSPVNTSLLLCRVPTVWQQSMAFLCCPSVRGTLRMSHGRNSNLRDCCCNQHPEEFTVMKRKPNAFVSRHSCTQWYTDCPFFCLANREYKA